MASTLAPVAIAMLAACGSAPLTAPDDSASGIVVAGAQVLRITLQAPCPQFPRGVLPLVHTRVTVTRGSSEWVALAGGAAGDLQVRFHQAGRGAVAGTFPVGGTMTGTAIHMPELIPVPAWDVRATFGAPASLTGVAFVAGALGAGASGLDGTGSGSLTLTDAAGNTCTGNAFSWSIFPPP